MIDVKKYRTQTSRPASIGVQEVNRMANKKITANPAIIHKPNFLYRLTTESIMLITPVILPRKVKHRSA